MTENLPLLSPRLKAIADLISPCNCFADIGTDHAYLPVYLCGIGKCRKAVASDVNKGPLKRAEKTVLEYGKYDKIDLRLGGGLETVLKDEADSVVIAGMGGLIIAKILEDGREKINDGCKIVLQPMTAVPELREYLYNNGWTVTEEHLVREDEKIYNIIEICKGESGVVPTEAELFVGKELMKKRPENYDEYLKRRIKKLSVMIDGLKASDSEESKLKLNAVQKLYDEISY